MKIRVFDYVSGYLYAREWHESEKDITSLEELKAIMRKLLSGMKKKNGFNDLSFQLIFDSGCYVVVDRYDAESESYRTTFHEKWNIEDNPVMRSQKNVMAWAVDIFKSDSAKESMAV